MNKDDQHLNLLATFHYVVGIISVLIALIPLLHIGIGFMLIYFPETISSKAGSMPPCWFGFLFLSLGFIFLILGQTMAIAMIISGRYLKKRKKYWFSFIVGCIDCLFMPFGTILGIFTIIVLSRDSVKTLYGVQ